MRSSKATEEQVDRSRMALQMADAVLYLANVAVRVGLPVVQSKLIQLHIDLLELALPDKPRCSRRTDRAN